MNFKLSKEQLETIFQVHENESWWYLFLNYGCPVNSSPEYKEKFNAISNALKDYIKFINEQEAIHFPNEPSKLYL